MGWFIDNGFSETGGGSVAPPAMPTAPAGWNDPNSLAGQVARGGNLGPMQQPNMSGPTPPGVLPRAGESGAGAPPPTVPNSGGLNIGIPFPGSTGAAGGSGGGTPTEQWIRANAPPNIANDPGGVAYWANAIDTHGGVGPGTDFNYWIQKMQTPDQGNSALGGGAAGGLGAFLTPYDKQFTAPTGTDDPGFQFALQQGTDQLSRGAAAKGNLQTGAFAKDLASYTTGAALQDYAGAYNRAANTFGMNYDIFRNNQTDPYNKLMGATGLGLNATNNANSTTSSYMNDLTNLTTGAGNVNAGATIGNANANNTAISGLANWFQNYHAGGNPY